MSHWKTHLKVEKQWKTRINVIENEVGAIELQSRALFHHRTTLLVFPVETGCRSTISQALSSAASRTIGFLKVISDVFQATGAKPSQMQRLVSDLCRRGPNAYPEFMECLLDTEQQHIVDRLNSMEERLREPKYITPPVMNVGDITCYMDACSAVIIYSIAAQRLRCRTIKKIDSSSNLSTFFSVKIIPLWITVKENTKQIKNY